MSEWENVLHAWRHPVRQVIGGGFSDPDRYKSRAQTVSHVWASLVTTTPNEIWIEQSWPGYLTIWHGYHTGRDNVETQVRCRYFTSQCYQSLKVVENRARILNALNWVNLMFLFIFSLLNWIDKINFHIKFIKLNYNVLNTKILNFFMHVYYIILAYLFNKLS